MPSIVVFMIYGSLFSFRIEVIGCILFVLLIHLFCQEGKINDRSAFLCLSNDRNQVPQRINIHCISYNYEKTKPYNNIINIMFNYMDRRKPSNIHQQNNYLQLKTFLLERKIPSIRFVFSTNGKIILSNHS